MIIKYFTKKKERSLIQIWAEKVKRGNIQISDKKISF